MSLLRVRVVASLAAALAFGAAPTFAQSSPVSTTVPPPTIHPGPRWMMFYIDDYLVEYADTTRVRATSPDQFTVWVRLELRQREAEPELWDKEIRHAMRVVEYDCGRKQSRYIRTVWYYRNGSTALDSGNQSDAGWAEPIPETVAEAELTMICVFRPSFLPTKKR